MKPCKHILVAKQGLWGKKGGKMTQKLWEMFSILSYMKSHVSVVTIYEVELLLLWVFEWLRDFSKKKSPT